MYTVYMHVTPSKKIYIGITRQKPVKRWLNGKGYQGQDYFYNAILKYGWDNIEHKILFTGLTKAEAEEKEIELIAQYKSNVRECGYNIQNGGSATGKFSEETIEKLRAANLGKHHTKDTCKKLSKLQADRWKNEEYRKEQIAKRVGVKPWNKGKKTTEEVKEKLSLAKLGKHKGANHWNAKKVRNIDTGKVYNSLSEIAEELNIKNASHIVAVCKGKRAKAYGYKWEYIESEGN